MRTIHESSVPASAEPAPGDRDRRRRRWRSSPNSGERWASSGAPASQDACAVGISMTQIHVLTLLEHHGEMPMSRLADMLDVSFSNATGLIDRMEENGFVERVRVRGPARRLRPAGRARPRGARTRSSSCATTLMRPPARAAGPEQLARVSVAHGRPPDSDRRRGRGGLRPVAPMTTSGIRGPVDGIGIRGQGSRSPRRPSAAMRRRSARTRRSGSRHRAKIEILFAILLGLFLARSTRRSSAPRCRRSSPTSAATSSTPGSSRSTC